MLIFAYFKNSWKFVLQIIFTILALKVDVGVEQVLSSFVH